MKKYFPKLQGNILDHTQMQLIKTFHFFKKRDQNKQLIPSQQKTILQRTPE